MVRCHVIGMTQSTPQILRQSPGTTRLKMLRYMNLSLLVLFPIAWFAPLLHAGLLPLFRLSDISVISGLVDLLATDLVLALVVFVFAMLAPFAKVTALAMVQFGWAPRALLAPLRLMGRLAMADIFLIALYVTLAKGLGIGRLEIGWGLYLMTFCVLASLLIGHLSKGLMGADLAGTKGA